MSRSCQCLTLEKRQWSSSECLEFTRLHSLIYHLPFGRELRQMARTFGSGTFPEFAVQTQTNQVSGTPVWSPQEAGHDDIDESSDFWLSCEFSHRLLPNIWYVSVTGPFCKLV